MIILVSLKSVLSNEFYNKRIKKNKLHIYKLTFSDHNFPFLHESDYYVLNDNMIESFRWPFANIVFVPLFSLTTTA